jgi:hypothetical protein
MSSPPESVVSGLPKMWGIKDIQDLQARDGRLFQKEIARRLYSDLKGLVLESLTTLRESTEGSSADYLEGLDHCRNWHPLVASEEMHRANARFRDLQVRVHAVSLLYGRILYTEQCKELGEPPARKSMNMQPPDAETLVRGFFARACTLPWVRNGSFWTMDPFQQDFMLKEAFRDALAQDCVLVKISDSVDTQSGQLGMLSEEVGPDDSVSCVMERTITQERDEASVVSAARSAYRRATREEDAVVAPAQSLPEETVQTPADTAPGPDAEVAVEADPPAAASVAPSAAPSAAAPRASSVVDSVAASRAPSVAKGQAASHAPSVAPSHAPSVAPSHAPSATSATSVLSSLQRKPIIVHLGGDTQTATQTAASHAATSTCE